MLKLRVILVPLLALGLGCASAPFLAKAKNAEDAYQECHQKSLKKDYDDAVKCFEVLKSRYQGTTQSLEAELESADNYYRKKDYLIAAEAYKEFLTLHPTSDKVPYAQYRVGMSYYKASPKQIDRDQKYLDEALQYLQTATEYRDSEFYPLAQEKVKEVRKRFAQRHFYVAKFYYRTGEYRSAIPRFNEVVTNYSELGLDEPSLFFMGNAYLELAQKDKAMEILSVLEQHFPSSHYRKKLASKLGLK